MINQKTNLMFDISIYKLIKSIKPIELLEIITKGTCDNHLEEIKRQIISIRGEWYLNNWDRGKYYSQ